MSDLSKKLDRLKRESAKAKAARNAEAYFQTLRDILALYQQVSLERDLSKDANDVRLRKMAEEAIVELGGQAEPTLITLDQYDHETYGPMLGVSDEGKAAADIRRGALMSPKCSVARRLTPWTIGVALDAERLGAVGETAVGPGEYASIRVACVGRLLCTTNVGTRVNLRHYLTPPIIPVKKAPVDETIAGAREKLAAEFKPFWKTFRGQSRKLTVLVQFDDAFSQRDLATILRSLRTAVASKSFCAGDDRHTIGLLVALPRGSGRLRKAKTAVDLACRCKLTEVAFDRPLPAAADQSLPGLLSYFRTDELTELLEYCRGRAVRLVPKMRVDTQTTARHVWTGLVVARNMGIELGKYGLTPLTFAEQRDVIVRINKQWFRDWCPAPACYIDYPLVADDQVYEGGTLAAGISKWIEMVASLRVKVVLIDTAKKWEHRRLLKASLDDTRGFLTLEEVRKLDAAAREQGIKALWAGGISLSQAFEFGKAEVFGIYVTSAASILVPVGKHYRRDPALATVRKPDAPSVARVKLLLESGFLVSRLSAMGMADQAKEMEDAARRLMPLVEAADKSGEAHRETQRQESVVYKLAEDAWRRHLKHHRKG